MGRKSGWVQLTIDEAKHGNLECLCLTVIGKHRSTCEFYLDHNVQEWFFAGSHTLELKNVGNFRISAVFQDHGAHEV